MIKKEVTIINKHGLHARPAVRLIQLANSFKSDVIICKGSKCANGKNILELLSLGVDLGDVILLIVNGEDEEKAFNSIMELLTKVLPNEDI